MSHWKVFHLHLETDVDAAWASLEEFGFTPLFANETPEGETELVVEVPSHLSVGKIDFVKNVTDYTGNQGIDWTSQWQLHGHDFHNGYVHVQVGDTALKLAPGPGFGDLSHPTTHLAMELLEGQVVDKTVLDIGCGSGVLTLAAVALQARHAYGVDIDDGAITHAEANAALNSMEAKTTFAKTVEVDPDVIVINMIWSEQFLAWDVWKPVLDGAATLVVSGILADEGHAYIASIEAWGWRLARQLKRNGWLGLRFVR